MDNMGDYQEEQWDDMKKYRSEAVIKPKGNTKPLWLAEAS